LVAKKFIHNELVLEISAICTLQNWISNMENRMSERYALFVIMPYS